MDTEKKKIVAVGFILVALSYMSIKLSTPALPLLQYQFHTKAFYLKLSGMLYLIFFAASQLFWGAISRFYARRHLIFWGLGISVIGALTAMLSTNVLMFIIGRIIEAIGMGIGSCMCRILMSDRLEKLEIAKVTVFFGLIFSFMPFIAPTTGQYLIILFGWRTIFAFFCMLLLIYAVNVSFLLPETKSNEKESFSMDKILSDYKALLCHPVFWSYMFGFTLYVGLMLGYYMAIPYWYMVHFGISDRYYTFLALFTAIPNVLAYYYGRFMIKKLGTKQCINFAYLFGALGAALGMAFSLWWKASPITIILPLIIIAVSTGLIQPSINAGLISHFREKAGIVSALIPVFGFGGAGVFFLLLTNISLNTLWPFTWILIGVVGIGMINRSILKRIGVEL